MSRAHTGIGSNIASRLHGQGLAVGQLMTWWEEMSEDKKVGLFPPGQVVLMPEM